MTMQQQVAQRKLAEQWGRGLITFAEYHDQMYQFYSEV